MRAGAHGIEEGPNVVPDTYTPAPAPAAQNIVCPPAVEGEDQGTAGEVTNRHIILAPGRIQDTVVESNSKITKAVE